MTICGIYGSDTGAREGQSSVVPVSGGGHDESCFEVRKVSVVKKETEKNNKQGGALMRSIRNSSDGVCEKKKRKKGCTVATLYFGGFEKSCWRVLGGHSHENTGSSCTSGRSRPTSALQTCAASWRGSTRDRAKPAPVD